MNYKNKYDKYKQKYMDLKYLTPKQNDYNLIKTGGSVDNNNIYVIVTGGSGTVGKALIKKLTEKNINVINIIRNNSTITTESKLITNISISDDSNNTLGLKTNSNVVNVLNKCHKFINSIRANNTNAKFFIVNSAADKDAGFVKKSMDDSSYKDINYHWSIYFTQMLVEFAKKEDIPLIHYSTVYVHKGDLTDSNGWGIERKYVKKEDKPSYGDAYVYGYVKALTEDIILDNYSSSFVIRLPGIIDTELTDLKQTSPSNVVLLVLNAYNKSKKENSIQNIQLDNMQQKYPITAQIISQFTYDIINKIKDCNIIVGGIINLGGIGTFTKYTLADAAVDRYKYSNYVKVIDQYTPNLSLPTSEKMLMLDSNLPECLKGMKYVNYKLEEPVNIVLEACADMVKKI